jgi:lysozyme
MTAPAPDPLRDPVILALKTDEGFRPDLYTDTTGTPTIGYGTACRAWSPAFALSVLRLSVDDALADVTRTLPWASSLSAPRLGILLEMRYNLGLQGLLGFTKCLAHLQAGEYAAASLQLTASLADHEEPNRVARWAAVIAHG